MYNPVLNIFTEKALQNCSKLSRNIRWFSTLLLLILFKTTMRQINWGCSSRKDRCLELFLHRPYTRIFWSPVSVSTPVPQFCHALRVDLMDNFVCRKWAPGGSLLLWLQRQGHGFSLQTATREGAEQRRHVVSKKCLSWRKCHSALTQHKGNVIPRLLGIRGMLFRVDSA